MAFGHWQIGLHIQQDSVFSVALTPARAGWALRRWWHIPLPLGTVENGQLKAPQQLLTTLLPWRKSLPQRHRVRLAFPAARTLQRKLPRPAMALRENELASWVSHAMARELEMAAAELRFDYTEDVLAQAYSVTAAQHKDVAEMLQLATSLHLNLTSLTPARYSTSSLFYRLRHIALFGKTTRNGCGRHAPDGDVGRVKSSPP